MKNALVKIMSIVLTLAAVVVAVGLLRPTHAQSDAKFKIDVVLWKSATDQDKFRVGLEKGMDATGGATISVDQTSKNILHIETKLPTVNTENPVFKLYKNKAEQTFTDDDKNLIGEQLEKAELLAHVEFDKEEVKSWTQDTKVQIFQGVKPSISDVSEKVVAKQYFVLDNQKSNVFVAYLSPIEVDKNLGVHDWGFGNATQWGELNHSFKVAGEVNEKKVAVVHLTNENPQGGGVIVLNAGNDAGKITSNINNENIFKDIEHVAGQSIFAFVIGKGNPYTVGDNIYPLAKLDEAVEKTFSFGFAPEKVGVTGLEGTTAVNKTTVFVETITPIVFETVEEGTEKEAKKKIIEDKLKEYFSIFEKDTPTNKIEIKEILTNYEAPNSSKFVLTLASEIDNTKEYRIKYDNKKESKSEKQTAEENLAIDKDAPILVFDTDVVEVEYGKVFDINLIPGYTAQDTRDGVLTDAVYVPGEEENNEKRFIDPTKKGKYEVLFKVVDAWGNESTQIVTFEVK